MCYIKLVNMVINMLYYISQCGSQCVILNFVKLFSSSCCCHLGIVTSTFRENEYCRTTYSVKTEHPECYRRKQTTTPCQAGLNQDWRAPPGFEGTLFARYPWRHLYNGQQRWLVSLNFLYILRFKFIFCPSCPFYGLAETARCIA